jgi:hypothetical protein
MYKIHELEYVELDNPAKKLFWKFYFFAGLNGFKTFSGDFAF